VTKSFTNGAEKTQSIWSCTGKHSPLPLFFFTAAFVTPQEDKIFLISPHPTLLFSHLSVREETGGNMMLLNPLYEYRHSVWWSCVCEG